MNNILIKSLLLILCLFIISSINCVKSTTIENDLTKIIVYPEDKDKAQELEKEGFIKLFVGDSVKFKAKGVFRDETEEDISDIVSWGVSQYKMGVISEEGILTVISSSLNTPLYIYADINTTEDVKMKDSTPQVIPAKVIIFDK